MNSYVTSSVTLDLAHQIAEMTSSPATMNPFFGPVNLMIRIILSLSKSNLVNKEDFKDINNQLDMFEMNITDLSRFIEKNSAGDKYFHSSKGITHQMRKLMGYLQSNELTEDYKRDDFFRTYENTGKDKHLWTLYEEHNYFLDSLAKESIYNKSYVTNVGNMLMESLKMGVTCSFSYEFLKNRGYNKVLQFWKDRLGESYKSTKYYEDLCVQMAPTAAKNDIESSLKYYGTISQQQFTDSLHRRLNSTYDSLSWMVLIYDGDVESSLNVFTCCGGIHVKKNNKNVVAYYTKRQLQYPSASLNRMHAALDTFLRPRVIAKSMYNFLRNRHIGGPIFACKTKYHVTAAYDKWYGTSTTSGKLFVANFVS